MDAITIDPDGTIAPFEGLNDLRAYQAAVGGYIQAVSLQDGLDGTMYMDEDGKMRKPAKTPNPFATSIAYYLHPSDVVVGTVVVVGPVDDEGNDTPLSETTLDRIKALAQVYA